MLPPVFRQGFPALLLATTLAWASPLRAVESTFISDYANWDDSLAWSHGVPGLADTAVVGIDSSGWVTIATSTTVGNLVIGSSGIVSATDADLVVVGSTTLVENAYPSRIIGASAVNANSVLDLGAFDGTTLDNGTFTAQAYNSQSATIQWSGAAVSSIGYYGTVNLIGENASFRTAMGNAFSDLIQNDGRLNIKGQNFTIVGDFSNSGIIDIASLTESSSFNIGGNLAENVEGELSQSYFAIDSRSGHAATASWAGAQIETIGSGAGLYFKGNNSSVRNSLNNADALANLQTVNGVLSITDGTYATSGDLSNSGYLVARAEAANATLTVSGSLAQNATSTLTGGYYYLDAGDGRTARIAWAGASIETIAIDADIDLVGDSAIINSTTGSNALAALSRNEGRLSIANQTVATTASFTNDGNMIVGQNGQFITDIDFANTALLDISGGIIAGGDLSLGFNSIITLSFTDNLGTLSFGNIQATGAGILDGELLFSSIDLTSYVTSADVLTLFSADSFTGAFTNILSGERIDVGGGGTFLFTISPDSVTLSDYQPIPEPSTYALLAAAGIAFLVVRRKRKLAYEKIFVRTLKRAPYFRAGGTISSADKHAS